MNRFLLFGLPLLVFAGLAALFLTQLRSGKQASEISSVLVGQPLPAFKLPGVSGRAGDGLSTDDFKGGQPTVLNIWASWCAPCKIEHPVFLELKGRGVIVHGVLFRDTEANARSYLSELGDPYTGLGIDAKGRLGIDLGVTGVPETFVIDGRGVVRLRHAGPVDDHVIKTTILPALETAKTPLP